MYKWQNPLISLFLYKLSDSNSILLITVKSVKYLRSSSLFVDTWDGKVEMSRSTPKNLGYLINYRHY